MRWLGTAFLTGVLVAAGCASEPAREWMKVNQKYTVEEFRRDHADCRRADKGYDTCMRSRGWVDMAVPAEKPYADAPTATTEYQRELRR